jgi:predicted AlkP superfamily phosphohydrolase/phosphomutase
MAKTRKILVIGIDGGCWSLLNRAVEAGAMPYLKEMMVQGSCGPLLSTIPPKTPAAWSAFQTSKNPGANGIFDFSWWDRQSHETRYVSAASLRDTIWDLAGRAGKRICAINVPMTYPPKPVEGVLVTGIMTPSMESEWAYPSSLKEELLRAVPHYHIFNIENIPTKTAHKFPSRFIDRMTEVVENRAQAAVFLIQREAFDLFMVHFQASDVIQHAFWGFMNPGHPDYNETLCQTIFDRFYRRLDEKIREIHDAFDRNAGCPFITVVLSDHGFQSHLKRVNLGWWLVKEGLLKVRKISLRRHLQYHIKRLAGRKMVLRAEFLWEQSRVYSFNRGNAGYLYFLETEPKKRQATQEHLRSFLESLRDPDTGQQIVKKIHPRDSIYHGDYIDRMPDWIVEPTDGYSFTGDFLPQQTRLFERVRCQKDFHIGMHHPEGILIVYGPGVKQNYPIKGASLLDLAPTLLTLLEAGVPKEMEGRILSELFIESLEERLFQPETVHADSEPKKVYSEEDVEKIQQRLRDLGYIE